MEALFVLALLFTGICFVFRKKLGIYMNDRKNRKEKTPGFTGMPEREISSYKILAFNAKDYATTKDLENMMELRLEQCLAGLSRQSRNISVELHAEGFVLVYLVKYSI